MLAFKFSGVAAVHGVYPLLDILSGCLAANGDVGIGDFRSRVFVSRSYTKTFRVTAVATPKQVNRLDRPLSTSPHARPTHLLYVSMNFAFVLYGEALYWTPTSLRAKLQGGVNIATMIVQVRDCERWASALSDFQWQEGSNPHHDLESTIHAKKYELLYDVL